MHTGVVGFAFVRGICGKIELKIAYWSCGFCYWVGYLTYITEDPRYNDSVRYQRFCCKTEFAVIKNPDMEQSNA